MQPDSKTTPKETTATGRPAAGNTGEKRGSRRMDDDKAGAQGSDSHLLLRLLRYGKPYSPIIAASVALIIVAAILETVGPLLIKIAVDNHIAGGDFPGLLEIVGIYVAVLAGVLVIRYGQILLTQYIGQRIIYDLRNEIFAHLQRLHQRYYDRNPVGRLMTRVTSDVEALNQMFTQGLVMIFGDVFMIIGIVIMMLSINTELALWTFSVIPLLFIASFIFRRKVRSAYGEIRLYLARINSFLQERISGISVVQLFNREREDMRRFRGINWDHTAAFIRTIFYYAVFFPVVEIVSATALAIIVLRGGWLVSMEGVTLGVLIAFLQYARMFFRPISDLSDKYNILQGALASSERLFKLLDTRPAIVSPADGHRQTRLRGEITFRKVRFAYDEDDVLHDINLHLPAGQRFALVGHTGSGKTTMLRLLGRLYDIQKGEILLDGVPLAQWDLANLRSRMAIVLQDVFLFSGTVLDNIRMNRQDIPREAVVEAAKMVNAHGFIDRLSQGYDALVREGGSNFSVGQKQLMSLARALVMNPDLLLLDEATANIDSESEALIQQALEVVLRGRTAIVIAHRLSTIQHVDRIIVMHRGQIREQGSHQELLRERGLYHKLYQLQYRDSPGG